MEPTDGSLSSLEEQLRGLPDAMHVRDRVSRYDLPIKLSRGSLGVNEEIFGEQLVFSGRGLTPKVVAAASQTKLNEVVELHEWASFWGALSSNEAKWINTFRAETQGRLLVPAARTVNAGVSMAMYADMVLLPDPLNPRNMHTIMKNAYTPEFRKLIEHHVGILALLAPLVRAQKIVFVSSDLAHSLASKGHPNERNPIRNLDDELFVEQINSLRQTSGRSTRLGASIRFGRGCSELVSGTTAVTSETCPTDCSP
jgi:hypothetical protein